MVSWREAADRLSQEKTGRRVLDFRCWQSTVRFGRSRPHGVTSAVTRVGHERNGEHMYVSRSTHTCKGVHACYLEEWKLGNSSTIHPWGQSRQQRCGHLPALSL